MKEGSFLEWGTHVTIQIWFKIESGSFHTLCNRLKGTPKNFLETMVSNHKTDSHSCCPIIWTWFSCGLSKNMPFYCWHKIVLFQLRCVNYKKMLLYYRKYDKKISWCIKDSWGTKVMQCYVLKLLFLTPRAQLYILSRLSKIVKS